MYFTFKLVDTGQQAAVAVALQYFCYYFDNNYKT